MASLARHARWTRAAFGTIASILSVVGPAACVKGPSESATQATPAATTKAASPGGEAAVALAVKTWTGDLDGMIKRRRIRILTPYSKTHYFIDKGTPRGITYEAGVKLETDLNAKLKTKLATKVHVVFIPTSRDALYQSLVDGRGDIIAAPITVTPERAALVDFTEPTRSGNVSEVLVTAPGGELVKSLDDLSGKTVAVRAKSIYEESLTTLNATFKERKLARVTIKELPGSLEDEDILEMVNAKLVPATIVNSYIADFWKQIFPALVVHPDIKTREGASVAWVVRKNSPKLLAALNPLIKANRSGTVFGNTLTQRYLQNVKYVKSATSAAEIAKFQQLVELFRKYGQTYDMDFLLMMAQGYQESRLDNQAKSAVGAVGIMQVMPRTGKELKVGDIRQVEANIHAGVKYMRQVEDTYFKDDPMDPLNKLLMTFASYNAGPARIRTLRAETTKRGLDPNLWFNNVERVVAEKIGRETVTYVGNIYKYYIAYTLAMEEMDAKKAARGKIAR